MTQASAARVQKLNKKKTQNGGRATRSFDQMVGDATIARLKPYVQNLVGQAAQQIASTLFRSMMQERAMLQTRQLAFERLLKANAPWFNDEVLAMAVADVEDESSGHKVTDTPAQKGDKVRLEFQARVRDQGEWTAQNKLAIHALLDAGPSGQVQTHQLLEENLVGLTVGAEKEFLMPEPVEDGQEPEYTRVKVKVIRVARPPAPPAAEVPAAVEEAQVETGAPANG